MQIIGIIPARYARSRFPGKPLIDIQGKSMVQRVYEQACKAQSLDDVIVATDDERISQHVLSFGGKVMLTASNHLTGTDRIIEVANQLSATAYINIQGDEPFIQPEQIDKLAYYFKNRSNLQAEIATLIRPCNEMDLINSANSIKVSIKKNGEAMYFSRSVIPFNRNGADFKYWKHIGMYGYTKTALQQISTFEAGFFEQIESLEQLRWLENGLAIQTIETDLETISIDVPEDLLRIK
jgi:3-deoxy-manno-octulosonate cytidylyltransferase (CMP-KDO synthetase)